MLQSMLPLVLASSLAFRPNDSTELRRENLMAALRQGGYTVILRHARTNYAFQEQRDPVPTERKDQRNLSDDGVKDAALMGVVFRKYGVKFAEIVSSPMYRCIETAEMAAGTPSSVTMALRVFPSTPEQASIVMKAPKKGTNRLLVTHHFVIETHVPGIKPGDVAESEGVVVKNLPDGKIQLVGRITLADWSALANPGGVTAPATGATHDAPAHGTVAAAGDAVGSAELPDTHAGHLAREYLMAFNSGANDRMRAFIESTMQPSPTRSTDDRLKSFEQLFAQFGPLTVMKIDTSESIRVVFTTKAKIGDVRVTLASSEAQPMKVSSVTFGYLQAGGHP